jgi:hypothetical protein
MRERQKYRGSVQDHRGGGEADALMKPGGYALPRK